ncbi:MAG: hypothetical protein BWZ04_02602 [Firmicutes bacterium ADurb.BinA205]|nr:MAG: hypothetical protein BWZ04_02602 [Firmicutes bacterium ADurb.BinA205]
MDTKSLFFAICAVSFIVMAVYYVRKRRTISSVISGALPGIVSLFLLEKASEMFSLSVTLNPFNIIGSLILGVPYVVIITIMNFL